MSTSVTLRTIDPWLVCHRQSKIDVGEGWLQSQICWYETNFGADYTAVYSRHNWTNTGYHQWMSHKVYSMQSKKHPTYTLPVTVSSPTRNHRFHTHSSYGLALYLKLFLMSFMINLATLVQTPFFQTRKLLNLFAKQRVKISCSNISLHSCCSRKCWLVRLIRTH